MGKIIENIPHYGNLDDLVLEYDDSLTGCDEIRFSQGFLNKTSFLDPYFYLNNDLPFTEIISYRRKNPNKESIVTLWNYNEQLFEFYCKDHKEEFDCVKDFIDFSCELISIENKLKYLYDNDREENG